MANAASCSLVADLAPLLTVAEVSTFLQVHDRTIRRWIASGRLRTVRVGGGLRITRDELARFIEGAT